MKYLQKICFEIFDRKFNINIVKKRKGRKQTYNLIIDSKAIQSLLNKVFEIPRGKKSDIVKIPEVIKKSNESIKSAFLIGIMSTEGGRRKRGVGLSTASKELREDLQKIFKEVGINVLFDKGVHKKYKKAYYGISFKREYLSFLMRRCRSGQTGQILFRIKTW